MNLLFWVLERAAPKPGAVLAERLWCTIPGSAKLAAADPGERFTVRVNGVHVVAEAWGDGPAVYLMHGWGGSRRQLDPFVAPLVAAGHRVISLDAPSHGESGPGTFGPRRGLLTEFSEALAATVAVAGPAHGLIAHSLGGTAAAIAMLDGLPVGQAVLISAMGDPAPYTVEFARWLGFGERIRSGFLRRLEKRVGRAFGDFDVLSRARETEVTPLPPLLVVHDRKDREVHYRDGQELAMAWPSAELLSTVGLGHRRILSDPEVITRAVNHVAAMASSSGTPR
ncbi:alpha/beta fold hydrolase [Rhizocola hellebori]|nr:alpha/beta fold hydrolase [Rhizocola hellebori]